MYCLELCFVFEECYITVVVRLSWANGVLRNVAAFEGELKSAFVSSIILSCAGVQSENWCRSVAKGECIRLRNISLWHSYLGVFNILTEALRRIFEER